MASSDHDRRDSAGATPPRAADGAPSRLRTLTSRLFGSRSASDARAADGRGTDDDEWSAFLDHTGRPAERTLEDTPLWNDVKQIARQNDRWYSQTDDGSGEAATTTLFREFALFFQAHVVESPVLLSPELDLDGARSVFERRATSMETTCVVGRPTRLDLPARHLGMSCVLLTNGGSEARDVRFVANGRDLSSVDGIVRTLLGDVDPSDDAPRDVVLRLLFAYRDAVGHGPKTIDTRSDPLRCNPVALFNFFGQSTCGVLATNFAILCATLGIPTRVWRNASHTLPEVRLDDRWCALDPDSSCEPFYPAMDDPTILLDLDDLRDGAPVLIERTKIPVMPRPGDDDDDDPSTQAQARRRRAKRLAAFRSRERVRLVMSGDEAHAAWAEQAPLRATMHLRPHERVLFGYEKGGPWYGASLALSLPQRGRAAMLREFDVVRLPDLTSVAAHGLRAAPSADGTPHLVASDSGGTLAIDLDNAFPIIDLRLTLGGDWPDGCRPEVRVEVSGTSTSARPADRLDDGSFIYRLRRAVFAVTPFDRITLHVSLPAGARLRAARVLTLGQIAPCALPALVGGANEVRLESTSPRATIDVRASFLDLGPMPAPADDDAVEPANGATVALADLVAFRWAVADGPEPPDERRYRVSVAHDERMIRVVSGNLYRAALGPRLVLDDADRSFLAPGATYFWRVQRLDDRGVPFGPWSRTFSFHTDPQESRDVLNPAAAHRPEQ